MTGDPACWAHLLCPECGAVIEQRPACWRCGVELPLGPPGSPDAAADEGAGEGEGG
jgi:hypothetical protein